MNNSRTFTKKHLSKLVAASMVAALSAAGHANEFALGDNQIQWVTTTTATGATIGSNGVASAARVDRTGVSLPNLRFVLKNTNSVPGTYRVKMGLTVQGQTNTDHRLEINLGEVEVVVGGGGDIINTSMVTSSNSIRVLAKNGTLTAQGTFAAKAGMLSFNTATDEVTLEVGNIINEFKAPGGTMSELFNDLEAAMLGSDAHYSYAVVVQPVSSTSSAARVGHHVGSTYTAFPRYLTSCAGNTNLNSSNNFTLASNELASTFTAAHAVVGTLSIGFADTSGATQPTAQAENCEVGGGDTGGGDTGGGDEEPTPTEPEETVVDDEVLEEQQQEAAQQEQAVDEELANLEEGGEVSEETVTNVSNTSNTVTETTNTVVEAINSGTVVSKSNILSTVTTASSATSTTTKVTTATSNTETKTTLLTQTTTTLTNTATVLNSLGDRAEAGTTTLTAEETTQVKEASTKLLTSAGNVATQTTDSTQLAQAAQAAAQVIQANTKLGIAADVETVITTAQVSQQIATAAIRAVVGADVSDEEIAELFEENDNLAETVLNLALPVPPAVVETKSQRDEKVQLGATQRGLTASEEALNRLSNTTRQNIVQPANIVVGGVNIVAKLRNLFRGVSSLSLTLLDNDGRVMNVSAVTAEEADIVVDEATGAVKVILPGETYAGAIVSVKSVPASVPEGIRIRRDGRGVIVTGGVAVELAPVALDLLSFAAGVENAGFEFSMRNNATVSLNLGNNERFSGAFAYDNLDGQDVTTNCGAVSFAEPTGALNSAEYSFGVSCANGIEQKVQPFVDNADFFRSVEAAGFAVRADRDSGMVTIAGVGTMKPSFFVAPPTAAELEFHAANKDSFGIAFQAGDVNGDGLVDYKVISASGTQVLYGTN